VIHDRACTGQVCAACCRRQGLGSAVLASGMQCCVGACSCRRTSWLQVLVTPPLRQHPSPPPRALTHLPPPPPPSPGATRPKRDVVELVKDMNIQFDNLCQVCRHRNQGVQASILQDRHAGDRHAGRYGMQARWMR
jgi:hypothetical protein